MRSRPVAVLLLASALCVGAAGCAEDVLTQDEFAEGLTDAGVDERIAGCTAAEVYGELGEQGASDAYDDEGQPTAKEREILEEASATCAGGDGNDAGASGGAAG